jgi:hypothetical protein
MRSGDAMKTITGHGLGTARYSKDGKYRYYLSRPGLYIAEHVYKRPSALWILLNPSEHDSATEDGYTMCKVRQITEREGFDGCRVVNLYALIATDPTQLTAAGTAAVGPENRAELSRRIAAATHVVCAWGDGGRGKEVKFVFNELRKRTAARPGLRVWCLGQTKGKMPRHPAHIGYDVELRLYEAWEQSESGDLIQLAAERKQRRKQKKEQEQTDDTK